jgi:DNA-binding NtrC family response regulator
VPPLRERGKDIELIFRKFTTDFAEKYRIKPIALTEGAKEMLMNYPFPGNIRQLKNISEQISILESKNGNTIDETILAKYLPQNQSFNNTSLSKSGMFAQEENAMNEREILYKVLFDMKRDMSDLKKLVLQILKSDGDIDSNIIHANASLFKNIDVELVENNHFESIQNTNNTTNLKYLPIETQSNNNGENVLDISHETEEVSLSLERQEKDMIVKALKKNRNKRKYAASDLGISERTLYRKIKQYDIEEN